MNYRIQLGTDTLNISSKTTADLNELKAGKIALNYPNLTSKDLKAVYYEAEYIDIYNGASSILKLIVSLIILFVIVKWLRHI